jgi:hypothetical protein
MNKERLRRKIFKTLGFQYGVANRKPYLCSSVSIPFLSVEKLDACGAFGHRRRDYLRHSPTHGVDTLDKPGHDGF